MTAANHIPASDSFRVSPDASRAVATLALIPIAFIIGLVIIALVAGVDLPAMQDFSSAPT